jgi:hypothetical protein
VTPRETALKIGTRKTIVRNKMDFLEGWFLSEAARSFSASSQHLIPESPVWLSHQIQAVKITFQTVLNNTEKTV